MAESDYHRQYRLYLHAARRWFERVQGPTFAFLEKFGGVYYLYVRPGMNGREMKRPAFTPADEPRFRPSILLFEMKRAMAEHSEQHPFLREIFPGAGPELLRLLQGAAENAVCTHSDFYTIRDWLEIAGYQTRNEAHAILLLLLVALEEGSLCIEIAGAALMRRLRNFVREEEAAGWARHIEAAADLPALIGTAPGDQKPVIAHTVGSQRFLYSSEKFLRRRIDFRRSLCRPTGAKSGIVGSSMDGHRFRRSRQSAAVLDHEQREALGRGVHHNFAVISGGPGAGKTTIVLTLLRCLVRAGIAPRRIAITAPRGTPPSADRSLRHQAPERLPSMQDASSPDAKLHNLAATTLHRLLGYRPTRNVFARHRENPIPADVVIVDEDRWSASS